MVSPDPCCFSHKKLSWLNCCAAFVNWKLISTLKNNERIFCQVLIRSFLNLVPIMRIANWTRISQSLSVVIPHDPYCYFWSKKLYWLKFLLISQTAKSVSTLRNDKPVFYLLIIQSFLIFPSIWLKSLKFESFSFFLFWSFKSAS